MSKRSSRSGVDRQRNLGAIVSNEIIFFEMRHFLEANFAEQEEAAVLDLGAGAKPYAPLYEPYFASCTSVDVPHSQHDVSSVDIMASAEALPFDDASFDCVICTEVLEHCPQPQKVMAEKGRVLKPGGRVFLTTPFLRPLHEMPHDYFRFTPSGIRELAVLAGLHVRSIRARGEYIAVALAVLQMPLGKSWYLLAKHTRLPFDRLANPLFYITIVLPQQLYFQAWRRVRKRPGRLQRFYDKLSYYTLGYVTELEKRHV
jgi:SAM-dependent methyltransferase